MKFKAWQTVKVKRTLTERPDSFDNGVAIHRFYIFDGKVWETIKRKNLPEWANRIGTLCDRYETSHNEWYLIKK